VHVIQSSPEQLTDGTVVDAFIVGIVLVTENNNTVKLCKLCHCPAS
jgi:hypothetical protein